MDYIPEKEIDKSVFDEFEETYSDESGQLRQVSLSHLTPSPLNYNRFKKFLYLKIAFIHFKMYLYVFLKRS
jgi:hypothetical protein